MSDTTESPIVPPVTNTIQKPGDVVTEGEAMVTCTVPRTFRITTDKHVIVEIAAGVQELPSSIVEHWYAKANGVTPYVPAKPKKATEVQNECQSDDSGSGDADKNLNDNDVAKTDMKSAIGRGPGRPPKTQK